MGKLRNTLPAPDRLPTQHPETGALLAVIETPRGACVKLRFDETLRSFMLGKTMPAGLSFPFDFGFIPNTQAEDGDPLDVLVLMDYPVPVGCVVEIRLVGIIEAQQTEKGEKPTRNDRLIAVALKSNEYADVKTLSDLPKATLTAVEEFFVSYNQQAGKKFKILHRGANGSAEKQLKKAQRK